MAFRACLVSLLAVCCLLASDGTAFGHAVLKGTLPDAGVTLKREPEQVGFRFSEPVEASFGAIEVFNMRAKRVDDGSAFHPAGRGATLATRLKPNLAKGTYTATYRVISADGHPVSGGLVFSIGAPSAARGVTVSELLKQRSNTGPVTQVGFGVARGLQYGAIALAIGAVFFLLAIWLPSLALAANGAPEWQLASEAFARRIRVMLGIAIATGVISGSLGIVFQGATAAGVSFWSALDSSIWSEVLGTRFGTYWGLRVLAWAGLGVGLMTTFATRRRLVLRWASLGATGLALGRYSKLPVLAVIGAPLGFLALSVALAGHAGLVDPTLVLLPANLLHVLAVSVWVSGLALLVFALPAATRRLAAPNRTRLLAVTLARFSLVAGVTVAILLASGLTQSIVEVRTLDNLTGTAFGRAVLIKFCLFVALLALGAYNRRRMVPRLKEIAAGGGTPGRTGLLLRRALRMEVALIVVVLGVTSALVSYAPSIAVSGGPVAVTRSLGPADLQLTVDPARVGPNQMHVYLTDKRTGAQFDRVKEFRVELALPEKSIGPIKQSSHKAGPGHYVMDGAAFGAAGNWQVKMMARVSAFDAYYTTAEVKVR